jgi:hypothetical protein
VSVHVIYLEMFTLFFDSTASIRLPPNQALQLTGYSAFQSIHGKIWHRTGRSGLPSQQAGS